MTERHLACAAAPPRDALPSSCLHDPRRQVLDTVVIPAFERDMVLKIAGPGDSDDDDDDDDDDSGGRSHEAEETLMASDVYTSFFDDSAATDASIRAEVARLRKELEAAALGGLGLLGEHEVIGRDSAGSATASAAAPGAEAPDTGVVIPGVIPVTTTQIAAAVQLDPESYAAQRQALLGMKRFAREAALTGASERLCVLACVVLCYATFSVVFREAQATSCTGSS